MLPGNLPCTSIVREIAVLVRQLRSAAKDHHRRLGHDQIAGTQRWIIGNRHRRRNGRSAGAIGFELLAIGKRFRQRSVGLPASASRLAHGIAAPVIDVGLCRRAKRLAKCLRVAVARLRQSAENRIHRRCARNRRLRWADLLPPSAGRDRAGRYRSNPCRSSGPSRFPAIGTNCRRTFRAGVSTRYSRSRWGSDLALAWQSCRPRSQPLKSGSTGGGIQSP